MEITKNLIKDYLYLHALIINKGYDAAILLNKEDPNKYQIDSSIPFEELTVDILQDGILFLYHSSSEFKTSNIPYEYLTRE